MSRVTYRALDVTFEIRSHRVLEPRIRRGYAGLRTTGDDDGPGHRIKVHRRWRNSWNVRVDDTDVLLAGDELASLTHVLRSIDRLAAYSVVESCTAFRGGAVVADGSAIALIGTRRHVDSMLALAVGGLGYGYLAGGVVAVSSDGCVRPFRRPIKWRHETAAALRRPSPPGTAVGDPWRLDEDGEPRFGTPLAAVVVVQPAGGDGLPVEVSPFDALVRLAGNAGDAAGNERQMFRRLEALARSIPFMSLGVGDAVALRSVARSVVH